MQLLCFVKQQPLFYCFRDVTETQSLLTRGKRRSLYLLLKHKVLLYHILGAVVDFFSK
jgi:hypothetical protein